MKKGFIIGLATGLTLTGASLVLANSQIQAILNDQIKITLNGQIQEFKDETTNETQYPITYHNRTYLPLRTVANLLGINVDYDESTNTALLTTRDYSEPKNLEFTYKDLIGTWYIVNPYNEYDKIVFKDSENVEYYLYDDYCISGTYGIQGNMIGMDFSNHFENKEVDDSFTFYVTGKMIGNEKMRIYSSPKYISNSYDIFNEELLEIDIDDTREIFDKTGRVFAKETNSQNESITWLQGRWKLENQFLPEKTTNEPTLSFNGNTVGYSGIYMYGITGGYFVDEDIIEVHFNQYSAVSVDNQKVDEQVIRFLILGDNRLMVLDDAKDVIYDSPAYNGYTVLTRELYLKEGFIFDRSN